MASVAAARLDLARYIDETDPRGNNPNWQNVTKEQQRQELARYMDGVPARRVPMRVNVKCGACHHRGTAQVPDGAPLAFRCSKCGSRLAAPVV